MRLVLWNSELELTRRSHALYTTATRQETGASGVSPTSIRNISLHLLPLYPRPSDENAVGISLAVGNPVGFAVFFNAVALRAERIASAKGRFRHAYWHLA